MYLQLSVRNKNVMSLSGVHLKPIQKYPKTGKETIVQFERVFLYFDKINFTAGFVKKKRINK